MLLSLGENGKIIKEKNGTRKCGKLGAIGKYFRVLSSEAPFCRFRISNWRPTEIKIWLFDQNTTYFGLPSFFFLSIKFRSYLWKRMSSIIGTFYRQRVYHFLRAKIIPKVKSSERMKEWVFGYHVIRKRYRKNCLGGNLQRISTKNTYPKLNKIHRYCGYCTILMLWLKILWAFKKGSDQVNCTKNNIFQWFIFQRSKTERRKIRYKYFQLKPT